MQAALDAAVAADAGTAAAEQARFSTPTPDSPAGESPSAPVQPEPVAPPAAEEVVEEPAVADTFDGGKFNPDELPPELRPGWAQLQAAFTKKTQELSEQRRQFEALGSIEELQQAAELYERISDPSNWAVLHAELSAAMEQHGLTPAEAHAAATQTLQENQPDLPALPDEVDDPELAPLQAHLKAMRAEIDGLRAEREAERQELEARRLHLQLVNQMQEQQAIIRQNNPSYGDEDLTMVTELSSFHNGDQLAAQERLEAYVADRIARYYEEKTAVPSAAHKAPATPVAPAPPAEEMTVEQAAREAEEYVRQLQAAGELEL